MRIRDTPAFHLFLWTMVFCSTMVVPEFAHARMHLVKQSSLAQRCDGFAITRTALEATLRSAGRLYSQSCDGESPCKEPREVVQAYVRASCMFNRLDKSDGYSLAHNLYLEARLEERAELHSEETRTLRKCISDMTHDILYELKCASQLRIYVVPTPGTRPVPGARYQFQNVTPGGSSTLVFTKRKSEGSGIVRVQIKPNDISSFQTVSPPWIGNLDWLRKYMSSGKKNGLLHGIKGGGSTPAQSLTHW